MWLLNTRTRQLVEFVGDANIPYAILSHTWEHDEVKFADMYDFNLIHLKAGYRKLDYTCTQAQKDGLEYAWIDTCCINKDSTAELSEAINSMYRWYYRATICYAYLSDVNHDSGLPNFEGCRWFSRGWTLQELIAPRDIKFFDRDWLPLGYRNENVSEWSRLSGVDGAVLTTKDAVKYFSTAQRLSWAANRSTTRIEDQAYCLLGLLGINMPLLYGEGERAFHRLQQEILRNTGMDFSVLSWDPKHQEQCRSLLAPEARCFRDATWIYFQFDRPQAWYATWTGNGLSARLPVLRTQDGKAAYLHLRSNTTKRLLKLRSIEHGLDAARGASSLSRTYEIVRYSEHHTKHYDSRTAPQSKTLQETMEEVFIVDSGGSNYWNLYVNLDVGDGLEIPRAAPQESWYASDLELCFSATGPQDPGPAYITVRDTSTGSENTIEMQYVTKPKKVGRFQIKWNGQVSFTTGIRQTDQSPPVSEYFSCWNLPANGGRVWAGTYTNRQGPLAKESEYFDLPVNHEILCIWKESADEGDPSRHLPSDFMLSRWTFDKNEYRANYAIHQPWSTRSLG